MRTLRNMLLAIVLAAGLAGCGSDGDDAPAADSSSSPEPASSADEDAPAGDPRLPEGTYRTPELTLDDLRAAADARDEPTLGDLAASMYGPDATIVFTIKIENGRWTQFESVGGGPAEVGSAATYEVVDDTEFILTEACCGKTVFEYTLDGDELTVRFAEWPPGGEDTMDLFGALVFESAPFAKIG